jgi:hypothetical protein
MCGLCLASPASAADIWLAGLDPFIRHAIAPDSPSDYPALFYEHAPWPRASRDVAVFMATTQYLVNAPESELSRMIQDLRRRHIALGLEALMLPLGGKCGSGVEGYSYPGAIAEAAGRAKRLGGTLLVAAMDDPLWFAHQADGPTACHSSIEEVARQIAVNVRALRGIFPDIRIGDIEPVALAKAPSDWIDEILQFAAAYRAATGSALEFVHADVDWHGDWSEALPLLAGRLRAARVSFGIIYDGDEQDDKDIDWTTHAEQRFTEVEGQLGLEPDTAILQTWMRHPQHMLPETSAGTMTNLVVRYHRSITRITLQGSGTHLTGRLTGAGGEPVGDARVTVSLIEPAAADQSSKRVPLGTVATDSAGSLEIRLPDALAAGSTIVAEFAGTDRLRGSRCESLWSPR